MVVESIEIVACLVILQEGVTGNICVLTGSLGNQLTVPKL